MACGTPVISSNVTSLSEVCNESALLINPYDINELKNSIEIVLQDDSLRMSMIKKGLIQSSKYSWNITANSTIQAYEKIIKF